MFRTQASLLLLCALVLASWLIALHHVPAATIQETPEQALHEVGEAVRTGDVAAFRRRISRPTIEFLHEEYGEPNVDDALKFLMHRIEPDSPFRVREVRHVDANTVVVIFETKEKLTGRVDHSRLDLIAEEGHWKLELLDAFLAWKQLAEWVQEVHERMERATPFLGTEGPESRFDSEF